MKERVFIIFACLFHLAITAQAESNPTSEEPISTAVKFEKFLEDQKVSSADDFISKSLAEVAPQFTLAHGSKSLQKGKRVLSWSHDGSQIFGVGATHPSVEGIFQDASGKTQFHRYFPKDGTLQSTGAQPEACVRCHGRKFTYIWRPYKTDWTGFHGESDDIETSDNKVLAETKKVERFQPLFKVAPNDSVFPYYNLERPDDRALVRMPNTRLTLLIGRRAARKVYYEISHAFPERYARLKFALMHRLYQCPNDQEENALVEAEYQKHVLPDQQKWVEQFSKAYATDRIEKSLMPAHKVLQMLGTNPDEIILPRAAAEDPKERIEDVFSSFYGGPLNFNIGDGTNISRHLLGAMWAEVAGPPSQQAPKESSGSSNTGLLGRLFGESDAKAQLKALLPYRRLAKEYQGDPLFLNYGFALLDQVSMGAVEEKDNPKTKEFCEYLKAKSLEALKSPPQNPPPNVAQKTTH